MNNSVLVTSAAGTCPLLQDAPSRPERLRTPISLRLLLGLIRVWRTRSRERSDLFRAPESVACELNARGMDVGREAAKPFWQP